MARLYTTDGEVIPTFPSDCAKFHLSELKKLVGDNIAYREFSKDVIAVVDELRTSENPFIVPVALFYGFMEYETELHGSVLVCDRKELDF